MTNNKIQKSNKKLISNKTKPSESIKTIYKIIKYPHGQKSMKDKTSDTKHHLNHPSAISMIKIKLMATIFKIKINKHSTAGIM